LENKSEAIDHDYITTPGKLLDAVAEWFGLGGKKIPLTGLVDAVSPLNNRGAARPTLTPAQGVTS
jgi:hypothetical protein